MKRFLAVLLFLFSTSAAFAACTGGECHVSSSGSGSTCSHASPCTIATAQGQAVAGDTISFHAGTYSTTVNVTSGGSSGGGKITYRGHESSCPTQVNSDINSRGVRPDPTVIVTGGFRITTSYIRIDCFKVIKNTAADMEGTHSLSHIDVLNNYVDGWNAPNSPSSAGQVVNTNINNSGGSTFDSDILVQGNYIGGGCSFAHLTADNVTVLDNESERVGLCDSDHVIAWGDTHVYRNNYFHGNVYADCPGCHSDCWQSWMDGVPANYKPWTHVTIDRNTCFETDEKIMLSGAGQGPFTVSNNIFAHSRIGGGVGNSGVGSNSGVSETTYFVHNLLDNVSFAIWCSFNGNGPAIVRNNIIYNSTLGLSGSCSSSGNVTTSSNPGFVNVSTRDYHLLASASTLINQGTTLTPEVTTDRDGNNRKPSGYVGGATDVGPYEYGAGGGGSAPSTPTGLDCTAGNTTMTCTFNPSSGATSYNCKIGPMGGSYSLTSSPSSSPCVFTGLSNGTLRCAVVSATNSFGTSAESSEDCDTPANTAPAAPTISATPGNGQVTITATNTPSGTDVIKVERSLSSGSGFSQIGTITPPATTLLDTNVSNGTLYYYRARGNNSAGDGSYSSEVSTTPQNCYLSSASFQTHFTFATQTGTFTATWQDTPLAANIDAQTGLSDGTPSGYTDLATIARFNVSGNVDARNGSSYAAVNPVSYTANDVFVFTATVNLSTHKYDLSVTKNGGASTVIASAYDFRTEQASVTQLNTVTVNRDPGTEGNHQVCNFAISAGQGGTKVNGPVNFKGAVIFK